MIYSGHYDQPGFATRVCGFPLGQCFLPVDQDRPEGLHESGLSQPKSSDQVSILSGHRSRVVSEIAARERENYSWLHKLAEERDLREEKVRLDKMIGEIDVSADIRPFRPCPPTSDIRAKARIVPQSVRMTDAFKGKKVLFLPLEIMDSSCPDPR